MTAKIALPSVTEQHHAAEALVLYEVHHVGYVGLQVDLRRGEVGNLAEAGEVGGVGVVAVVSQPSGDPPPAPTPIQAPPTST